MSAHSTPPDNDAHPWDALPGMVLLLAANGAALNVNDAFCAFAGRSRHELLGHGWSSQLRAASRVALLERLGQADDFMLGLDLAGAGGAVSSVACLAHRQVADGPFTCILHNVQEGLHASPSAHGQASLFRLLADNVPVLIAYYNASDFRCQFANKRYAETFGRDEHSILGSTFEEVIGVEAARQIQPQVERMLQQRVPVVYERTLPGRDGSTRWIEVHLLPHLGPLASGTGPLGAFVLITDISKFRLAEQAVRESEERLAKFMQASAEGIVFHKDGVITDANPPLLELLGYTLDEVVGRRNLEFIPPDHVAQVSAVIASGQETAYESIVLTKSGERIAVEFIVRTMLRNGEHMRMTIVRDIRDRHAAQAHIHHLAHHDALTGLPNRVSFMEHLERSMLGAQRHDSRLALLFIDLDHFKRVNDSLGHLVGDSLLRSVGARITSSLRGTDIVARFGGDEFMVLLVGLSSGTQHAADAQEVAHKLLTSIGAAVHAEGRPISVTPSIGIALYPGDGDTPEALVKNADSAMYLAKARGRANYQFFEPGIAASAYAELVLEGQLAQALERGEFVLFFQPQVRARDGVLVGAEALIRWHHPERGLLLADEFISVAEKRQLMIGIGQWVLHEATRCALRWRDMGLVVAPVAVNLSNVQFQSSGFLDAVERELPGGEFDSGLLELELTERMLMDDLLQVKHRLERLKAMGLRISVDDFGTGYSSLGHLKDLPIDKVKIDRSFVHDLPLNRDSAAITSAIVQMGRSLGLTVIAEGVETEAQRDFLATLGCDELQGMLISPPLPQLAFEAWVRQRQRHSAVP
jgi:diguanylate cyclase (GGDEF)-like protein/PAS domain S-box-containing protein